MHRFLLAIAACAVFSAPNDMAHAQTATTPAAPSGSVTPQMASPVTPLLQPSLTPLADMSVKDPITVGFRLGYTLTMPQYAILGLDEQIQTLRDIPDGPAATQTIGRLARMATGIRQVEYRALQEGNAELLKLGAPQGVSADESSALALLCVPLDTQPTADASKESDPATVKILATIEEADRILPKSWSRVTIWLKFGNSPDAAWGFHLGQLTASLRVSEVASAHVADLELVDDLRRTAPASEPKPVHDALDDLAKAMRRKAVNQELLAATQKVIDTAYIPPQI